jgi:hypothetical protein
MELQAQINKENKYLSKPLIMEAGNQVPINGGKIGEVVQIPADDEHWWDK